MTVRDEALQVLTGLQNDSTYVELPRQDMARSAIGDGDIPSSLDDLIHTVTRTYDLSVTAAGDLKIPVIGGVGGGFNRRVVLLERSSFAPVEHDKVTYRYGYALRLAITVNKLSAQMQLSLPFLAASAEVGQIEGRWMLQVVGLAGDKIDRAILPPKELSVETFVLATQSLEKLISAVRHSSTSFSAAVLGVEWPTEVLKKDYRIAVGRA